MDSDTDILKMQIRPGHQSFQDVPENSREGKKDAGASENGLQRDV